MVALTPFTVSRPSKSSWVNINSWGRERRFLTHVGLGRCGSDHIPASVVTIVDVQVWSSKTGLTLGSSRIKRLNSLCISSLWRHSCDRQWALVMSPVQVWLKRSLWVLEQCFTQTRSVSAAGRCSLPRPQLSPTLSLFVVISSVPWVVRTVAASFFFFFLSFFFGHIHDMWKFPGQGWNWRPQQWPELLHWQCQILNPLSHRTTPRQLHFTVGGGSQKQVVVVMPPHRLVICQGGYLQSSTQTTCDFPWACWEHCVSTQQTLGLIEVVPGLNAWSFLSLSLFFFFFVF